jgi:hypothetical protein
MMDEIYDTTGVQFEEDKWKNTLPSFVDEPPKVVQLVTKYSGGIVKDQKTAEYVLFGFVVSAIIISLFLFLRESSSPPSTGAPQISTPQSSGRFGEPPGTPFY